MFGTLFAIKMDSLSLRTESAPGREREMGNTKFKEEDRATKKPKEHQDKEECKESKKRE